MNKETHQPAAFIFDMDGVIVDNSKYHNLSWIEFCRRHGKHISSEEIEKRFGNTNVEYIRHIFGDDFSDGDVKVYGEEKERIYREMFAANLAPANGLVNWLGLAHSMHIPCAVATAAPPSNVDFVLGGTRLKDHFELVVDAHQVKKGKPDPEIYLTTARLLNVAPAGCVVFEDSFFGIRAGKAAGMKVVAITSSYPAERILAETSPDLIIDSFTQLEFSQVEDLFK